MCGALLSRRQSVPAAWTRVHWDALRSFLIIARMMQGVEVCGVDLRGGPLNNHFAKHCEVGAYSNAVGIASLAGVLFSFSGVSFKARGGPRNNHCYGSYVPCEVAVARSAVRHDYIAGVVGFEQRGGPFR